MATELIVVPTYNRPEFLHLCLKRIRKIKPQSLIAVFPDRGTADTPEFEQAIESFMGDGWVKVIYVPNHDYYGNSYNALEALRWAYNFGPALTYFIEDDVIVHEDFFDWHRAQYEENDAIFGAIGWVFNRYAPIEEMVLYQPWYYAIGTSFPYDKLKLIVEHASPLYYADMQGYIERVFSKSNLNSPFGIQHFEQDGLIQRIIDVDRTQTASPGIAKCDHIGFLGYNRGWNNRDIFEDCNTFEERVRNLELFAADPYARASTFGRDIVEREVGRELPPRKQKYRVSLPEGNWSTSFATESMLIRPKRVNGVRLPPEAVITKID